MCAYYVCILLILHFESIKSTLYRKNRYIFMCLHTFHSKMWIREFNQDMPPYISVLVDLTCVFLQLGRFVATYYKQCVLFARLDMTTNNNNTSKIALQTITGTHPFFIMPICSGTARCATEPSIRKCRYVSRCIVRSTRQTRNSC